jgi:hypothetical protein
MRVLINCISLPFTDTIFIRIQTLCWSPNILTSSNNVCKHDIIFTTQRGIDSSMPKLSCSAYLLQEGIIKIKMHQKIIYQYSIKQFITALNILKKTDLAFSFPPFIRCRNCSKFNTLAYSCFRNQPFSYSPIFFNSVPLIL